MSISTVFTEKKDNNTKLKRTLGILLKFKPLGLIKLSNNNISEELIEWLKCLPVWFVVYSKWENLKKISNNLVVTWEISNSQVAWFDFIVCDDNIENLNLYLEKGVVPIISKQNHMSSILNEFNPLKNEWNSFFYEEETKWSVFYWLVRYLENYKFPQDNKNLVKNVLKI